MYLLRVIESFKSQTFSAQFGDLSEGIFKDQENSFVENLESSPVLINLALNSKERKNVT
jgi:hypothetical protein